MGRSVLHEHERRIAGGVVRACERRARPFRASTLKSGHKRLKSRPGGVQEAFLRALTEQRCLNPRALAFECLFLKKNGLKELKITSRTAYVELKDWPVAYHGTDSSKLGPILEAGLRRPGELPSVQMVHGNAGAGPSMPRLAFGSRRTLSIAPSCR